MGEWLEFLLVEAKYYSTILPRIPVPIARLLKVKVSRLCTFCTVVRLFDWSCVFVCVCLCVVHFPCVILFNFWNRLLTLHPVGA